MKKEIVMNGVTYVRKDSIKRSHTITGKIKIVLLQRGWIMIGVFSRKGNTCYLDNASVIRKWGTKAGIGELAANGRQPETVLDKCFGRVEFDYLTVVAMIDCEVSKWKEL